MKNTSSASSVGSSEPTLTTLPSLPESSHQEVAIAVQAALSIHKDSAPISTTVREALARREINPGFSIENDINKAMRVALWALHYFPGETISYQSFLSWKTGTMVQFDSPAVALFRKQNRKLFEEIAKLNIPCVAWLTEKQSIRNPHKVDGFRLTFSGDDYAMQLLPRNKKRVKNSMLKYVGDLNAERIPLSSINDPLLKKYVREEQVVVRKLNQSEVIPFFIDSKDVRLLTK